MWCLETIVALNDSASEKLKEGKGVLEAYKSVGIQIPQTPVIKKFPLKIEGIVELIPSKVN
jgi:hypothetical protein